MSRCAVCGGDLIGAELSHGTCGHCGGRSLDPRRRRQVAQLTMVKEPDPATLEALEAQYAAGGYAKVQAVAVPANFEASHTPWEVKVFAEGLGMVQP